MTALPPIAVDQRKIDANHLNLLSIFHFISAGLALLGILFLAGHFAIFNAVFSNPEMWQGQKQRPPPMEFFALFKWFYLFMGTWFLAGGIMNLLTGFYLRARTHRTFSFVTAVINCLHMPLGTILGVFTIVVLTRRSVAELYEA